MATEMTRTEFQGILFPDEQWTRDKVAARGAGATDSDHTEAGAFPGDAVPQQTTDMALEASHEQSDDGHLEVQCLRGGHPGIDGAELGFRDVDAGDIGNGIKGWDSFQAVKP